MKYLLFVILIILVAISLPLFDLNHIGYIIFYGLLLFMFISSLLHKSKHELYQNFKYLTIWLGIFAIGFVIITYKEELLNSKIAASFRPGHAESDSKQLTFYKSKDNHFYINTYLNGQMIRFLLDTGATHIILSRRDALKLGIKLHMLNYNKRYNTANGYISAASVVVDKFQIGDLVFYDVPVTIANSPMNTSLAGMSLLSLFKNYSFDNNKVILTK